MRSRIRIRIRVKAVLWIHDILIRIRILGSVTLIYESGFADPDPDLALFVRSWQDANFFKQFFCLLLFEGTFIYLPSKVKCQKISLLFGDGRIRFREAQKHTDPTYLDQDPQHCWKVVSAPSALKWEEGSGADPQRWILLSLKAQHISVSISHTLVPVPTVLYIHISSGCTALYRNVQTFWLPLFKSD